VLHALGFPVVSHEDTGQVRPDQSKAMTERVRPWKPANASRPSLIRVASG
jgi:hypothetical protein